MRQPLGTDFGALSNYALDEGGLSAGYDTTSHSLKVLSDQPISGGSHQSPSPDGKFIVLDTCDKRNQTIYLFSMLIQAMPPLIPFTKYPVIDRTEVPDVEIKSHTHPVFSRGGKYILFNRCEDGILRLCELEIATVSPH